MQMGLSKLGMGDRASRVSLSREWMRARVDESARPLAVPYCTTCVSRAIREWPSPLRNGLGPDVATTDKTSVPLGVHRALRVGVRGVAGSVLMCVRGWLVGLALAGAVPSCLRSLK